MRTFIFLFCTAVFALTPANTLSQNAKIKVTENKKISVDEVFDIIMEQTDVKFFYEEGIFKDLPKLELKKGTINIGELLKEGLLNDNFDITISKNNTVVIKEKYKSITSIVQKIKVTGKITDQAGIPIPGVNVIEKGTTNGIQTDLDGTYSIAVTNAKATLVISFVGFETKEISVNGRTNLNIALTESAASLNEVVVVGYGTQKKKEITGSISSINEKTLREVPVTNATQLLEGRISGAYVTSSSNKPGASPSITIRGNRSFSAGNGPLYVVDGIPINDAINDINPSDIVSIEVLKDASATAIYGSRGANGVILITTARGKVGGLTVKYNTYTGVTHVTRRADNLSGEQFVKYKHDAFPNLTDAQIFLDPAELKSVQDGQYTNWQDLMIKDGYTQSHDLSILGATEKTKFNISLGYLNDTGYFKNQDYTRYNVRINLDQKISDKIKGGVSLLGSYSEQNGGSYNPYYGTVIISPLGVPYDQDSKYIPYPTNDQTMFNPLAYYQKDKFINLEKRTRILASLYAEAEILEGLKFRMNFGPDLSNARVGNFNSTSTPIGVLPTASTSEGFSFSYTLENLLTYDKKFGKHKLNFTGLYSIQGKTNERSGISVKDLPVETVTYYNLGSAGIITGVSSDYEKWSILSYMGRLNYGFDNRFSVTLTGRADGSSRFAPGNKWSFFPSAAVAYNISEEKFLKDVTSISNLKLRLSYGLTGNQGIDPYQTQGLLDRTRYDFNGTPAYGYAPSGIPNQDLKWETSATGNVGIDFGFFNQRITGTIEAYQTTTSDLLLPFVLPGSTGFSSVTTNIGSTQNRGVDFSLSTQNIVSTNGFNWSTDFTAGYNKGKILELSLGKVDDVGNARFIGQPLRVYYDYEKIGIWQTGEAAEAAKYSSAVGQIKVKDQNEDGKITPDDRKILGSPDPTLTYGFNNNFSFKGFDLSIFVVGVGNKMIRSPFYTLPNNTIAFGGRYNQLDLDYWTPTNPTNAYPQPIGNQGAVPGPVFGSTLKYFNGEFVRVRNINIGYNLSKDVVSKIKLQAFRLYLDVTNPFVFSSYTKNFNGIDPEILDNPATVNFQLGLNVKF